MNYANAVGIGVPFQSDGLNGIFASITWDLTTVSFDSTEITFDRQYTIIT